MGTLKKMERKVKAEWDRNVKSQSEKNDQLADAISNRDYTKAQKAIKNGADVNIKVTIDEKSYTIVEKILLVDDAVDQVFVDWLIVSRKAPFNSDKIVASLLSSGKHDVLEFLCGISQEAQEAQDTLMSVFAEYVSQMDAIQDAAAEESKETQEPVADETQEAPADATELQEPVAEETQAEPADATELQEPVAEETQEEPADATEVQEPVAEEIILIGSGEAEDQSDIAELNATYDQAQPELGQDQEVSQVLDNTSDFAGS